MTRSALYHGTCMKISLLLSALALMAVLALSRQDGPNLPDGEGKDLVADACANCHDLARVAAYTGTEEDWAGVVYTMRARGLALTPEENEQIVAYLAKSFPPPAKEAADSADKGNAKGKEKGKAPEPANPPAPPSDTPAPIK